jgi:2-polyprenyl-3-methyl-5-hydroxy-6-metoxy-1,4-benzoquinol methylase
MTATEASSAQRGVAMPDLADRAGQSYWDQVWQGRAIPKAFDPRVQTRNDYVQQRLHEFFVETFANSRGCDQHLLEIGAASSIWLPYFAKEFGFAVAGIDYSEVGCEQARAILRQEGIAGRIVHSDFVAPPEEMIGAFDVVVSFGVIEHFAETTACIASFARFMRPNGLIVSFIPNLVGAVGWLQKRLCRSIFDVHVPLDCHALRQAHEHAGLEVLACRYFLGGGFTTLNLSCRRGSRFYSATRRVPRALSIPFTFLDQFGVNVKPNRLTSPYVICLAQK